MIGLLNSTATYWFLIPAPRKKKKQKNRGNSNSEQEQVLSLGLLLLESSNADMSSQRTTRTRAPAKIARRNPVQWSGHIKKNLQPKRTIVHVHSINGKEHFCRQNTSAITCPQEYNQRHFWKDPDNHKNQRLELHQASGTDTRYSTPLSHFVITDVWL